MTFIFVQSREPHDVLVIPMERQQLHAGREQWRTALESFDSVGANEWPEPEPAALDDDPLMIDFTPANAAARRFELPVGELAL